MISRFNDLFYNDRVTLLKSGSWEYPFGCCGCTYSRPPKNNRIVPTAKHSGIRIIPGTYNKPTETDTYKLDHINTRNGNLTVVVKKIKNAS